jgi:hypothetical protein
LLSLLSSSSSLLFFFFLSWERIYNRPLPLSVACIFLRMQFEFFFLFFYLRNLTFFIFDRWRFLFKTSCLFH